VSFDRETILKSGSVRIRVHRTGMFQVLTFTVKRVQIGQDTFSELYTQKILDRSELERVANETGLPVEAQNGRAMPDGKTAKDFITK
jgi:hypothetical protein